MRDFLAGVTGIKIISFSNVSPIEIMRDNCILKLLKVSIVSDPDHEDGIQAFL